MSFSPKLLNGYSKKMKERKKMKKKEMMVLTCNPSAQEAEAAGW